MEEDPSLSFIQTLLDNMPRRCQAVIDASGFATKYLHVILHIFIEGRGGLVVRSRLWGRRVPGSKPDSTDDPPCMGPVAR
ncbi:hypothetical protein AVEN_159266-1 [Araneus ventricosus]|uniref:Uncharacterized protein n=1 Tax=Araneus ventricosus TaxID=182803 RepID=A0A4Y2A086_ARAVE|nr:hypothetical protein AVEN_159266-1 [Araneus ventricosus]